MTNFICETHIWSSSNSLLIPGNTTAYNKYYTKKHTKTTYSEEKISYNESRDILCKPDNKWRENLAIAIQELNDILVTTETVKVQWISRNVVEIILANGNIITITVNEYTGDIMHIHKDTTLTNKSKLLSSSSSICDVLLTSTCLILSYNDCNFIDYLRLTPSRYDDGKLMSMTSVTSFKDNKPKINKLHISNDHYYTEFNGPNGNVDKHLSFNVSKNLVLLWFPNSRGSTLQNIFIYFLGSERLELVGLGWTCHRPIFLRFSDKNADVLISVEISSVSTHICLYKIFKGQVANSYSVEVPTQGQVISCDWSTDENRVVMACDSGSLILFCISSKVTRSTKLFLVPFKVIWLSNNSTILVISKSGQIQFYDVALNRLKSLVDGSPQEVFTLAEASFDLTPEVVAMAANACFERRDEKLMDVNECLLLSLKNGPVVMVTLGLGVANSTWGLDSRSIFNQHLREGKLYEANELLHSLDWTFEGSICFFCLSCLINHLLKLPANDDIISYVQSALSKFYSPTNRMPEVVAMEFGDSVSNLARRYFSLLLRLGMFEKCYLLSLDLQQKDLFMDLYYAARDFGETSLADACRRAGLELGEEMVEMDFKQDDRDSIQSLDSLDSLYDSITGGDDDDQDESCLYQTERISNEEAINELMRDTEMLLMNDLNDEFTQFFTNK